MRSYMNVLCVSVSVVVMPFLLAGCDREVSRTSHTTIKSDGSSKTEKEVVKQAPDGTVTKEEVTKKVDSDGAVKSQEKTTVKSPDGTVSKEESKKTSPPTAP